MQFSEALYIMTLYYDLFNVSALEVMQRLTKMFHYINI